MEICLQCSVTGLDVLAPFSTRWLTEWFSLTGSITTVVQSDGYHKKKAWPYSLLFGVGNVCHPSSTNPYRCVVTLPVSLVSVIYLPSHISVPELSACQTVQHSVCFTSSAAVFQHPHFRDPHSSLDALICVRRVSLLCGQCQLLSEDSCMTAQQTRVYVKLQHTQPVPGFADLPWPTCTFLLSHCMWEIPSHLWHHQFPLVLMNVPFYLILRMLLIAPPVFSTLFLTTCFPS